MLHILHTSDWHLGRQLYGRSRYEESQLFLNWLAKVVRERQIAAVVVAGDIFDTTTPSNRAQELYYGFLHTVATTSSCRHVIVTAGNHDSPSFLEAPRALLKAMHVHVVGFGKSPEEEVLVLKDAQDTPELIVCAVPYLRDREIRSVSAGESLDDKIASLLQGIRRHYDVVAGHARHVREELGGRLPVVMTGHLFAAGGTVLEGDGVRELYVGSLAHIGADIFPSWMTYVALGHLHVPQKVGGMEHCRYSGSPLPMGFGEAGQRKSVCLVGLEEGREAEVELLPVPVFQHIEQIRGDWTTIAGRLSALSMADMSAWLEIVYEGEELIGDLRHRVEEAVSGTRLEVLRIKNQRAARDLPGLSVEESAELAQLDERDVFELCMEAHEIAPDMRPELRQTYAEVLRELEEEDVMA
ncbi:exonuclease SbcCD subunit D C-terminal domain-containing protein [Desulfovibrio piger]|nr:exonuclease SbcCD subunit D C-terminal domain-containing protein [Desulfovibrio piger]